MVGNGDIRLKCLYSNANSVVGKMHELRERVEGRDIIGIAETWATDNVNDAELSIEGYTLYRHDRKEGKGGGLIMYIKKSIESSLCTDLMHEEFNESLWCTVRTEVGTILVGLCYRSPASTSRNNDKLLELFRASVKQPRIKHVLIIGDFNYPDINYSQHFVTANDDTAPARFFNTTQEFFLFQNVALPTRVRQGQQPSVLDYIFTDEDNLVDELQYNTPLGKSDHVVLQWDFLVKVHHKSSSQRKLNYWKGDYDEISRGLQAINWQEQFSQASVEQMWTRFKTTVNCLEQQYVPVKSYTTNRKRKNKWITKATVNQIKKRDRAWKQYRQFPSTKNFENYKQIRNKVVSMIRADEEEYNSRILWGFKGKPKRFYGHMRRLQTVKDGVSALKRSSGELTTTDQQVADVLGNFFQSVFTKEEGLQDYLKDVNGDDTALRTANLNIDFTKDAVINKLQRLQPDKSAGPDNLHPILLRNCAAAVAEPLSIIFRKSFETGDVPVDWKTANIVPIYKKGSKTDPANYRPVSLTSVPCKIMESFIKEALLKHLNQFNMISELQHGFMEGRSCLTNLLESLECWTKALDDGYGVDVLYLDYRKAFDSVPHKRLLQKLSLYGVNGSALMWIENFLTLRTTRVGVRGYFSDWFQVLSGVPQGSVLGPLLFLLFVNELPSWIVNSMRMFADDTKVWAYIRSTEDSQSLQKDLDNLTTWSKEWLLHFNPDKCKVMHIGHKFDTKYYMMDDTRKVELQSVSVEKDLGVFTTDNLKPSLQCQKAAAKARSVLGMVRRNFRKLNVNGFLLVYKSYIRPHLEYCVQAWSPYHQKDIQCLESVQRAATKLVPSLRKLSYEDRLNRLGLTTLYQRRIRGDLIETYKILTGKVNVASDNFFRLHTNSHNTRGHSLKLSVQRSRLDVRKNFFSLRVVRIWNGLPQDVVNSTSVTMFKKRLDKSRTDWI